jgi:hypothetical protein
MIFTDMQQPETAATNTRAIRLHDGKRCGNSNSRVKSITTFVEDFDTGSGCQWMRAGNRCLPAVCVKRNSNENDRKKQAGKGSPCSVSNRVFYVPEENALFPCYTLVLFHQLFFCFYMIRIMRDTVDRAHFNTLGSFIVAYTLGT